MHHPPLANCLSFCFVIFWVFFLIFFLMFFSCIYIIAGEHDSFTRMFVYERFWSWASNDQQVWSYLSFAFFFRFANFVLTYLVSQDANFAQGSSCFTAMEWYLDFGISITYVILSVKHLLILFNYRLEWKVNMFR